MEAMSGIKMCWFLFLILVFSYANRSYGSTCQRSVCYYNSSSQHREGYGQLLPENIDPKHCTHLIFAFAKVQNNSIAPMGTDDEDSDTNVGLYTRFNRLKDSNPELKTLIAIGGINMGRAPFSDMESGTENRMSFIKSCIAFLRFHNFDGLDLNWEYSWSSGSPPDNKIRFTLLVQELAAAFQAESTTSMRPRLILSAAVAARKEDIDAVYEVGDIAESLDMINIMSYDFYGGWISFTGHNSPLYSPTGLSEPDLFYSTDYAARYWAEQGAPKYKINVGLATYGRSFTLTNSSIYGVGASASGPGYAGPITQERGFLSYYEICTFIVIGARVYNVEDQQVPFLVNNSQWVGYENIESITEKVKYVKDNGFGGIMIWSLDTDDFRGVYCGQGRYPLVSAATRECNASVTNVTSTMTETITPTTTRETARIAIAATHPATMCTDMGLADGNYRNPNSCTSYIACSEGATYIMTCPSGLFYNSRLDICDWPENVPECSVTHTATTCTESGLADGNYPNPDSCTSYIACSGGVTYVMPCPSGLLYHSSLNLCDFPDNVPECTANDQE